MKHCVELNDVCQMDREEGNFMNDETELNEFGEELPEALKPTLRMRFGPVPDVPSSVDEAILTDARKHFEQHGPAALRLTKRRRVAMWQWTAIGSTVAAACVVFFAMQPQPQQPERSFAAKSNAVFADTELKSDVDRNGRVDILDAFVMARHIRSGQDKSYDINRDGRFDKLDIDMVAREAVKL
jgi:hypothetical protein